MLDLSMNQIVMKRNVLLFASLLGLIFACAAPTPSPIPTAYPPEYLPTVIALTAEAANEIGGAANFTLATGWVNMVRARVSMPPITFVDQATLRADIKKERRVELGMESERFFDLVRWGDAVSVLSGLGYTHKHRYYPIPQQAIDRSGGILTQNPEW